MTALTHAGQVRAEAKSAATGWFTLAAPGSYYECGSGGFLANVGEEFPVWCEDMAAVRRLLLERDLAES